MTSNDTAAPATRSERFLNGFRALRNRNFRIYWLAQIISLTGSWMQTTAQGWLALELTNDPLAVGLVTTYQFLPMTLLAMFGGVIADRFAKQRLVLFTQWAALLQALLFGVLVVSGVLELWHLYLLALLQGVINAVDQPSRIAFVGELVNREDLINAVGLTSMQFNVARILGPSLAGITIAAFGSAPALFFNAVSFLALIIGLGLMDQAAFRPAPPPARESVLQSLLEGLRYIRRTPKVIAILFVVASIGTFGFNVTVILPLLAGFVLNTDAVGFGGLATFFGIGALGAAINTAFTKKVKLRRLIIASLAFGALLCLLGLVSFYPLTAVLLILWGFCGVTFGTSANSRLQLLVPETLRGRVMGVYLLLFIGSTPIGALLIGWLSNTYSVPVALVVCGVLCILGTLGALLYHERTKESG
jgi:MFS family permease